MFLPNRHPDYRKPLGSIDAEILSVKAAEEVERYLVYRDNHAPTPLHALPALAAELEKDYDYESVQTCAVDGMCQTAGPRQLQSSGRFLRGHPARAGGSQPPPRAPNRRR